MFINLKNANNNDTVYATVRMNKAKYREFRSYMHCSDDKSNIVMPYGVHFVKVGFGWYRIVPLNENRAIDKVKFAITILNRYQRELEKVQAEEIRRLLLISMNPGTEAIAYCDSHYVVASRQEPQEEVRTSVSLDRLYQLKAKFNFSKGL